MEKFTYRSLELIIVDNCDKWKVPRRSRRKCHDFDMSYVLGKKYYFSQEERHKQGEPFFAYFFQKLSCPEVRYNLIKGIFAQNIWHIKITAFSTRTEEYLPFITIFYIQYQLWRAICENFSQNHISMKSSFVRISILSIYISI